MFVRLAKVKDCQEIYDLIKDGNKFYGNIFRGKYLDCGTLHGYINSGIEIFKEKK